MNTFTFRFASGVRQEYILPDDATIRELVDQFVEDGFFGSQHGRGRDAIGYSFTPQGGQPIKVEISNQGALDQTIGALGFQSGTVYFAEEDVCGLYGCPTSREIEGLTPESMIEETVELIDIEL